MTNTTDKPLGQLEDERRLRLLQRLQDAHRCDVRVDVDRTWVGTCACGWVSRNPGEDGVRADYQRHLTGIAERMIETGATDMGVPGRPVGLPEVFDLAPVEGVMPKPRFPYPNVHIDPPWNFGRERDRAREVAATGMGQGYKTTGEIMPPTEAVMLMIESPPCEMFARPDMKDVTPEPHEPPSEDFGSQRMNRLRKQLGTEAPPQGLYPLAAALQELHDTHRALGRRLDDRRRTDPRDQVGAAAIQGKMKGVGIAITLLQPHVRRERLRNAGQTDSET